MSSRNSSSSLGLSRTAASGAIKTASGQLLRISMQLLSVVVLTRFLAPSDYGIMAIILALTGLATLLCDMGLSLATTQAKDLSREQRDKIFWLNTMVGFALGGILIATAPLLAAFYNMPEIKLVAQIMASIFVFAGITTQYRASLVRGLRFGQISIVEVSAQLASLTIAICIAIAGLGYWALVAQALGTAFLTAVGMISCARWFPKISRKPAPIRSLMGYGAAAMTTQLVNYASVNAPALALGRFASIASVGLYTKGFQLFSLPLTQIAAPLTSVALPVLARLREDAHRFNQYICYAQRVLTYGLGMIMSAVAIGGEPLVSVVLGEQWRPAGVVTQILALGGIFQTMGYANYWIFLAKGRMPVLLFFEGILRVAMIPLVAVGASIGLTATAAAYSLGLGLIWAASTFLGLPRVDIRPSILVITALRPLIMALCTYSISVLVRELLLHQGHGDLFVLAVSYLTSVIVAGLLFCFKSYRSDLSSILGMVRKIRA